MQCRLTAPQLSSAFPSFTPNTPRKIKDIYPSILTPAGERCFHDKLLPFSLQNLLWMYFKFIIYFYVVFRRLWREWTSYLHEYLISSFTVKERLNCSLQIILIFYNSRPSAYIAHHSRLVIFDHISDKLM